MSDNLSPPSDLYDQPNSTEYQDDLANKQHQLPPQSQQQPSSSSSSKNQRSTWAYIKWVWWTTIAGLFDCSAPILTAPFDNNTWPSSASASSSQRSPIPKPDLNSHSDPYCVVHSDQSVFLQKSLTPVSNHDHEDLLNASIDILDEPLETVELDSSPFANGGYLCEFDQDLEGIPLSKLTCSKISSREPLLIDEICSSDLIDPGSFTLISSLNADAVNGLIDNQTRDLLIKQIIHSVIPRNLSDCSEVYIPLDARKMYAWTKPPASNSDSDGDQQTKFDLEMSSTASDDQYADPGGRTLSDHSFSPLSPSTVDGAGPMEEYLCKTPERPNDLGLPKVDRCDQTLAWAMSNLQINMTNESDAQSDSDVAIEKHKPHTSASSSSAALAEANPSETTVRKNSHADRPPLPTSQHRPSRDRSPAPKLVPHRNNDTSVMPTFMPFDGAQIFESASSTNGTETVKPKRSSSLKSSRTPPGTPVQKAVRFADALGLDLTTVRHVFDSEAPPKIPASATFDLKLDSDESIAKIGAKQFGLCFAQPGSASNFIRHVLSQTVCLEDAHVDMPRGVLTGTVRVKSLGFEKRVFVRITYNNWITFCDSPASYVHGSHDGATDRFSFSVVFPDTMVPGDKAVFAIRYETHTGEQFWDNNHGQNYAVTCYAKATDLAGDGSWVHFL